MKRLKPGTIVTLLYRPNDEAFITKSANRPIPADHYPVHLPKLGVTIAVKGRDLSPKYMVDENWMGAAYRQKG